MRLLNDILKLIFPAACRQCGGSVSSDAPTAYFCNRCWGAIKWFDGPCCARCGMPYPLMPHASLKSPSSLFPLSSWEGTKGRGGSCSFVPRWGMDSLPPSSAGHLCGACRKKLPSFDKAISAGPFEGALAEAIKLFKYKKKIHVGRVLASFSPFTKGGLRGIVSTERLETCSIIPVPLHPSRLREREFNQSAIIASALGESLEMPVLLDVLIRSRHTRPQVELDMKERKKNVVGAFKVQNEEMIMDKKIILVDDVYTTGSTVNECAKALKKSGAKQVCVITIARMVA